MTVNGVEIMGKDKHGFNIPKSWDRAVAPKPKGPVMPRDTKADRMARAKAKGIKYFRVMTKAELDEAMTASPERVAAIQTAAVKRWKAGQSK